MIWFYFLFSSVRSGISELQQSLLPLSPRRGHFFSFPFESEANRPGSMEGDSVQINVEMKLCNTAGPPLLNQ